jgi:hypothetical protein
MEVPTSGSLRYVRAYEDGKQLGTWRRDVPSGGSLGCAESSYGSRADPAALHLCKSRGD